MTSTTNFSELAEDAVAIELRVYEAVVDRADESKTIKPVNKQCNNTIWATNHIVHRYEDRTINDVINELVLKHGEYSDAEVMLAYPFKPSQDRNAKCSFTMIYGEMVKLKTPDYYKPIIVQGERTPESVYKAMSEACKYVYYTKPFILIIPEMKTSMYDLIVRYMPSSSIRIIDSSKEPTPEGLQHKVDTDIEVHLDEGLHDLVNKDSQPNE